VQTLRWFCNTSCYENNKLLICYADYTDFFAKRVLTPTILK
jgi:hypothetical protein